MASATAVMSLLRWKPIMLPSFRHLDTPCRKLDGSGKGLGSGSSCLLLEETESTCLWMTVGVSSLTSFLGLISICGYNNAIVLQT